MSATLELHFSLQERQLWVHFARCKLKEDVVLHTKTTIERLRARAGQLAYGRGRLLKVDIDGGNRAARVWSEVDAVYAVDLRKKKEICCLFF